MEVGDKFRLMEFLLGVPLVLPQCEPFICAHPLCVIDFSKPNIKRLSLHIRFLQQELKIHELCDQ